MTINAGTSLNKAREIINAWDFSSIVERSIKKGMHPAQADLALSELREFLFQCSILPDTALSPQSVECDDLWHEFIVADTRAYFSFCDAVYGHYLHHDGVTLTETELKAARANSAEVFGVQASSACGRLAACGRVASCGRRTGDVACGKISMLQA